MTLLPQYVDLGRNRREVLRYGRRVLYTDGSYDNGVAGWAVVEDNECIHADWGRGMTSNMAEGMAILSALRLVRDSSALILSDSMSWVTMLTNRRPTRGKGTKDIFSQAEEFLSPLVQFEWVPGHSNISGNEIADSYATNVREAKDLFRLHP